MTPFYGWGSSACRLEPLWGGSLLYQSLLSSQKFQKFPEKAESTLEPSTGFEHGAPGFGIQHPNHLAIEVNL